MNQGGWYSPKAVIKDLARATGIKHFDENAFVIGERPPPSRICNEDDPTEMYLRCGGDVPETTNEASGPDLDGITEMLRMIDTYNDINEVSPATDSVNENAKPVENILTISKLNPNVKEFLPVNSQNTESSDKENDSPRSNINQKHVHNTINDTDKKHVNCAVQVIGNEDASKKKEIKEKLKTKISSITNATSIKVKHERNIAIMSLLKLYSQPPGPETNTVKPDTLVTDAQTQNTLLPSHEIPSTIKLLPPNYYEKSFKTEKDNNYDHIESVNTHLHNNTNSVSENVTTTEENIKDEVTKATDENKTNVLSVNNDNKKFDVDDDVQVSVEKVTKWLESNNVEETIQTKISSEESTDASNDSLTLSSSSKSSPLKLTTGNSPKVITPQKEAQKANKSENPSLYLGPVTFKRKGIRASNSPSLSSSDITITKKTPSSTYVPSPYANELSKTYMDRANTKKEMENHIWSKVEEKLKRIDAMAKKNETGNEISNEATTSYNQDNSNTTTTFED